MPFRHQGSEIKPGILGLKHLIDHNDPEPGFRKHNPLRLEDGRTLSDYNIQKACEWRDVASDMQSRTSRELGDKCF